MQTHRLLGELVLQQLKLYLMILAILMPFRI
nr:MAG TPA: hypothetical protein [Caudoviricetes sp.]